MRGLSLLLAGLVLSAEAATISKDARCGAPGHDATCLNSAWGSCCSQYGWCGSTNAYCNAGCQPRFGNCKNTVAPPATPASPVQPVSNNARCGPTFGGQTCQGSKWGNCCSQYSYCGSSLDYCGPSSCQKGYGKCDTVSSAIRSSSTTAISFSSTAKSSSSGSSSSISRSSSPRPSSSTARYTSSTAISTSSTTTSLPAAISSSFGSSRLLASSTPTLSPVVISLFSSSTSPSPSPSAVGSSTDVFTSSAIISSSATPYSTSISSSDIAPSPAVTSRSATSFSEVVSSLDTPSSSVVNSSSDVTPSPSAIISSSARSSSSETASSSTKPTPYSSSIIPASVVSSSISPTVSTLPPGVNVMLNPGFENNAGSGIGKAIANWSTSYLGVLSENYPLDAHGGNAYVILYPHGLTPIGSISQNVSGLDATQQYTLAFYYDASYINNALDCTLSASLSGRIIYTATFTPTDEIKTKNWKLANITGLALLSFTDTVEIGYTCRVAPNAAYANSFMLIDDVTLIGN